MIFSSFYWAKTAFVSLLMIASITFEATAMERAKQESLRAEQCSNSVSKLFNSIVGTSANEGKHSAASNSNVWKEIDVTLYMDWLDMTIQEYVENGKYCKIKEEIGRDVEEAKIELLNNVRYDLMFTTERMIYWKNGAEENFPKRILLLKEMNYI
uniref:SCP domain-containing protein n=1 Tax=Globodera pallida TaxID=36090 RepID=A0A183CHK5_GLOPA